MLEVAALRAGYGGVKVLDGVSLVVSDTAWVTIVGANGAGKTTLLWAISGLLPRSGKVSFMGEDITKTSAEGIVARGLVQVPQGRQLFGHLSVEENLALGAFTRRGRRHAGAVAEDRERVLELFPEVASRLGQAAGTLSGGEQQMLAIGRALMARPRLLLLDEPSTGLAPLVVQRIFKALDALHDDGIAILLVEQDAQLALEHADEGHVMHTGSIALSGPGVELAASEEVREIYFGKRAEGPTT